MSASPALPEKTRETYTPEDLPRFVNDECQECGIPVRGKRSQRRHALGHLPDLVPGHHATKSTCAGFALGTVADDRSV
ncbi:hypothetical protein HDZ31DRAFT_62056 [Schizophyllum fasciatum]